MVRAFLRYEKSPTTVSAKNAANTPHFIPFNVRFGKIVLAKLKSNAPDISSTEGNTQPFVCDNLNVARRTGTNINAARIRLRRPA